MADDKTKSSEPRGPLVEFSWTHALTMMNRLELAVSRMRHFDPLNGFILEMVGESSYQVASSLIHMWKTNGFVHTSLTELSHAHSGSFNLLWNTEVALGLKYFDTSLRSFAAGIRSTNIRVNYTSPLYVKHRPFEITVVDLEHVETLSAGARAYSHLARMISETFIMCSLLGVARRSGTHPFPTDPRLGPLYFLDCDLDALTPLDTSLVGEHIKHGFCCALIDHGVPSKPFSSAWDANSWNRAVDDVADALRTDVLPLNRIARIAERFVRLLEAIPDP